MLRVPSTLIQLQCWHFSNKNLFMSLYTFSINFFICFIFLYTLGLFYSFDLITDLHAALLPAMVCQDFRLICQCLVFLFTTEQVEIGQHFPTASLPGLSTSLSASAHRCCHTHLLRFPHGAVFQILFLVLQGCLSHSPHVG